MAGPNYNVIPGDWQNLEYIISDLCSRILNEDTSLSEYILASGTRAFTGNQSLGGYKLTNVANPTADQDAATKKYADDGFVAEEVDPVFTAWLATVTPANWNTAYGWGNHAGLYLKLDQTTPQTFANLGGGTGLMKVTAGLLGLDTSAYLTSLSGAWLTTGDQTGLSGTKTGTYNIDCNNARFVHLGVGGEAPTDPIKTYLQGTTKINVEGQTFYLDYYTEVEGRSANLIEIKDLDANNAQMNLSNTLVWNFIKATTATLGETTLTGILNLREGTAVAGTAPLRFTSGTSLTTAVAGAMEYTTDNLFFTIATGTARKQLLMADPVGGLTSTRVPYATTNGRLTDTAGFTFDGTTLTAGGFTTTGTINTLSTTRGILSTGTTDGYTIPSGAGTRFMWIPSKGAIRAGLAVGTNWDTANIGNYSVAFGSSNKASGTSSFAGGYNVIASGSGSAAFGFNNQATGLGAVSMGNAAKASGEGSVCFGTRNEGEEDDLISSGVGSVAIGYSVNSYLKATGNGSVAMGNSGDYGGSILATGLGSVVMGVANGGTLTAEGQGSIAMGENVGAITNPNVLCFGRNFNASTQNSFNIGFGQVDLQVTGTITTVTKIKTTVPLGYAEMYMYEDTTACVINAADTYHAVYNTFGNNDGVLAPELDTTYFTRKLGAEYTIASVATYSGGTQIQCTVTAGHALLAGEPITITGSANYDGKYLVQAAGLTATEFVVTKAYVATNTGSARKPATLKCLVAGKYEAAFSVSGTAANPNDNFKWELNKDLTSLDNISARAIWQSSTKYENVGSHGLCSLTAGQYVWLSVKNYSGANNLTMGNVNVNLHRLI